MKGRSGFRIHEHLICYICRLTISNMIRKTSLLNSWFQDRLLLVMNCVNLNDSNVGSLHCIETSTNYVQNEKL